MELLKNKDKRNGLIGTVLFHAILLLIFIFYGLTYQYPPPEQGILINFGTSDQGMGEIQPIETNTQETVQEKVEETPVVTTEAVSSNSKVVTQEEVETISVPKETEAEKQERIAKEEQRKKEEAFKQKMTDIWKNKQSNSEGETGQPGDQGSPEGSLDAKSHIGGPEGGGGNYYLAGRKMLTTLRATYNDPEEGKVVVDIIVDRNGNVLRATIARETTVVSQKLRDKAIEEAMKAKFSPAKDIYTPEEQKGKIIVYFTP